MNISLDYDGTISADVEFWVKFVAMAKEYGHTVAVVTNRHSHAPDSDAFAKRTGVRVILAAGDYKSTAAYAAGFPPSVYIDDNPVTCQKPHLACSECGEPMETAEMAGAA